MKQTELWRDIIGYEGCYQVSNLGRVKSVVRTVRSYPNERIVPERILQQQRLRSGYISVGLWKNHKFKRATVHRLVANAFLSNPENLPQVNHKDGNKGNNSLNNLEWCSRDENMRHAYRHGLSNPKANLINNSRSVRIINKHTGQSKCFKSLIEAAKYIDEGKYKSVLSNIFRVLSPRYPDYKSVHGYYIEGITAASK